MIYPLGRGEQAIKNSNAEMFEFTIGDVPVSRMEVVRQYRTTPFTEKDYLGVLLSFARQ